MGAEVVQDRIYVMGGNDGERWLSSVECFHPNVDNTFRRWHDHDVRNMLHSRSNFASCVVEDEKLMVFGGYKREIDEAKKDGGDGHFPFVDAYCPNNNVWTAGASLNFKKSGL